MKIIMQIELDALDVQKALCDYVVKNGGSVPTDSSFVAENGGYVMQMAGAAEEEAPKPKPKRKPRKASNEATKNGVSSKTEETKEAEEAEEELTIAQEASRNNEARIQKEKETDLAEKVEAVTIGDCAEDIPEEDEAEMEAKIELDRLALIASQDGGAVIEDEAKENTLKSTLSTVDVKKKSIFKKRAKAE